MNCHTATAATNSTLRFLLLKVTCLGDAAEFAEMRLRHTEKKPLKELNIKKKSETRELIRYPIKEGNGCIRTTAMKVSW